MAKSNPPWTSCEERKFIESCTTRNGKWKSADAKNRFVNEAMKRNLALVFSIYNKMAFNKDEDTLQRAVIGMVDALRKYDPSKKHKISTWITNPIRWAIMQHQSAYGKNNTIMEEIYALNYKMGLKMSVVSLDAHICEDGDETIKDIISANNLDLHYLAKCKIKDSKERELEVEISDAMHELAAVMHTFLNKKEMYVINGLLKGRTQTDISKELHLSKVRISQIQASAFEKIRNSSMAKYLSNLVK